MTKYIDITKIASESEVAKKETVFTHNLNEEAGWVSSALTSIDPEKMKQVIYLGNCREDGDIFAVIFYNGLITTYKGVKGDEF